MISIVLIKEINPSHNAHISLMRVFVSLDTFSQFFSFIFSSHYAVYLKTIKRNPYVYNTFIIILCF